MSGEQWKTRFFVLLVVIFCSVCSSLFFLAGVTISYHWSTIVPLSHQVKDRFIRNVVTSQPHPLSRVDRAAATDPSVPCDWNKHKNQNNKKKNASQIPFNYTAPGQAVDCLFPSVRNSQLPKPLRERNGDCSTVAIAIVGTEETMSKMELSLKAVLLNLPECTVLSVYLLFTTSATTTTECFVNDLNYHLPSVQITAHHLSISSSSPISTSFQMNDISAFLKSLQTPVKSVTVISAGVLVTRPLLLFDNNYRTDVSSCTEDMNILMIQLDKLSVDSMCNGNSGELDAFGKWFPGPSGCVSQLKVRETDTCYMAIRIDDDDCTTDPDVSLLARVPLIQVSPPQSSRYVNALRMMDERDRWFLPTSDQGLWRAVVELLDYEKNTRIWDHFKPVAACPGRFEKTTSVSTLIDGGKWGQTQFEDALRRMFGKESTDIFIFDCVWKKPDNFNLGYELVETCLSNFTGVQSGLGPVDTLENIVKTDYVDILKMDIEGSEWPVLEHVDFDRLPPVGQIQIEFHPNMYKGHFTALTLLTYFQKLERAGFVLVMLEPVCRSCPSQYEAVFLNTNLIKL